MKKILLKVLIGALIISAVLGIGIIILDLWNDLTGKILLTTVFIFGFSIPGLCCSTIYDRKEYQTFSFIGMIICLISCFYYLLVVWELITISIFDDDYIKLLVYLPILSSSFGHISLLLLIKPNDKTVSNIRTTTIVLSALLDLLLFCIIMGEASDIDWRFLAILCILIALGTIITPILNRLNKKNETKPNTKKTDKYDELDKLKQLLDNNTITEEEFNKEKEKILNK